MARTPEMAQIARHHLTAMVSREHGLIMVENRTEETTIPYVLAIHGDDGQRIVGIMPDGSVEVTGDIDEGSRVVYDALARYGATLKTELDRVTQENADLRAGFERIVNELKAQAVIRDALARQQWEASHPPQHTKQPTAPARKSTSRKKAARRTR